MKEKIKELVNRYEIDIRHYEDFTEEYGQNIHSKIENAVYDEWVEFVDRLKEIMKE